MTWRNWLNPTSTQESITDVVRARASHWERYQHETCPDDECELHPMPLTDQIDPDQGFWRATSERIR